MDNEIVSNGICQRTPSVIKTLTPPRGGGTAYFKDCLATNPEGEPIFCHSPGEFGIIFWAGGITDNGPRTIGWTDLEVEIVFALL